MLVYLKEEYNGYYIVKNKGKRVSRINENAYTLVATGNENEFEANPIEGYIDVDVRKQQLINLMAEANTLRDDSAWQEYKTEYNKL